MDNTIKKTAKKGGKLWLAKKGLEWTGSILKLGAIIGAGYFIYKFLKENEEEIRDTFS